MRKHKGESKVIRVQIGESSVWANQQGQAGDTLTLQLQHDYPDLKPEPGQTLTARSGRYQITKVADGLIECAKLEETNVDNG